MTYQVADKISWKGKLLKADPATFEALSAYHAKDASQVYFSDKRMRLAKGAGPSDFRSLSFIYGTDARTLYFLNKRIDLSKDHGLGLSQVRLRAKSDNSVNMPTVFVSDGMSTFVIRRFGAKLLYGQAYDRRRAVRNVHLGQPDSA